MLGTCVSTSGQLAHDDKACFDNDMQDKTKGIFCHAFLEGGSSLYYERARFSPDP